MAKKAHPRSIGGYAVLRFLGEGGAGRVYACKDAALDRDVAVKILRPEVAEDKTRRDRFLREGRMMARIQSPHVASIFAVGEHDGVPFLVMELLEGQDLETRLRAVGRLAVKDALTVARQACLGLDAAQRLDVIHRDVKPANIVLTRTGAKLTDFGLARPQDGSAMVTTEGLVTGTPAFLAPERAMGKGDDLRSDIYSLGATLYTLISGQPPFMRETPIEVITAQLREEAPPLEAAVPDAGVAVGRLVRRMMEKAPEKRFQSYNELIEAIDTCLLGHGVELTMVNDPFGATHPSSVVSQVGAPTGVLGTLRQMSVTDITQMLEIGRKTAGIDLEPTGGAPGELGFVDGQVVYARLGALWGPDAYYAMVSLKDGTFRIRYGRPAAERNIDIPTQFLMLEAMRRVDEAGIDDVTDPSTQPVEPLSSPPSLAPDPISALDQPPSDPRLPVRHDAPTLRAFLPPDADIGSLDALPGAPPPVGGLDPLEPQDTLVVNKEDSDEAAPVRARLLDGPPDPGAGSLKRPAALFEPTPDPGMDLLDDKTAAFPTMGYDDDDDDRERDILEGPTLEQPQPDITAPEGIPTHPTPDSLGPSQSFDDDPTLASPVPGRGPISLLEGMFQAAPWLRKLDAAIAGAATRGLRRARREPWLIGVVAFPLLIVLVALVVMVVMSGGGPEDPKARIADGEGAAVLAELDALPSSRRSGTDELLRAELLLSQGRRADAVAAVAAAQKKGAHAEWALRFLVEQLDRQDAGPVIDLLVDWPGEKVTELLVAETEREAYLPRKHAVTALDERGASDRYSRFAVAIKDLKNAPACNDRRTALLEIKDRARDADPAIAKAAREAVEAAAQSAGNECMLPILKKMLPHRFR